VGDQVREEIEFVRVEQAVNVAAQRHDAVLVVAAAHPAGPEVRRVEALGRAGHEAEPDALHLGSLRRARWADRS
jgi:hypothetical protein